MGVIVVSSVSPSVSFADSSLVRGSLELPPSDEGGGATEKCCLSVASEGEITVNNHLSSDELMQKKSPKKYKGIKL